MPSQKYRHKCSVCGRSRSRAFHRQYPAGPGYPEVKGVCAECRSLPSSSNRNERDIHIHHHHWLHLSDELELVPPERTSPSRSAPKKALTPAAPRNKSSNPDPPPGYSELPADQNDIPGTRLVELADVSKAIPYELPVNNLPFAYIETETPPPVGPKPRLSRFSLLRALRS
ncbi:hypothetical protein F5Y13DRAFT_153345 [Hypoxylon sp. FL1857]|nr:hypothetical protein F5Y13DRAFT_153345 [Hypoxylon sp. FL1857]